MKATNRSSAYARIAGSISGLLLLFVLSASFHSAAPTDGFIEKAFTLDNFAKETLELTVEQPGDIVATAEWAPQKAELALILFGPGKMNYYERSDGKSPLKIKYTVTELDMADGNAWRLKLINQSGETVEGILRANYPKAGQPGEAEALQ